jgi:hypothetical protein
LEATKDWRFPLIVEITVLLLLIGFIASLILRHTERQPSS